MKCSNIKHDKVEYCDLCCLQPNGDLIWSPFAALAIVDGPTRNGPWAFMCERHLHLEGISDYKGNIKLKFNKGE